MRGHGFLAANLWKALKRWRVTDPKRMALFEEILGALWQKERPSLSDLRTLAVLIPMWLHKNRLQTITLLSPGMAKLESMLSLTGSALLRGETASREFTATKESTSWRATVPLRAVVDTVRRMGGWRLSGFSIKPTKGPDDGMQRSNETMDQNCHPSRNISWSAQRVLR
jgi:hypothetical protein